MNEFDLPTLILLLCVVGFILPLLAMGMLGFILFRRGKAELDNLADPNADKLYAQYAALYQAQPDVPTERHVKQIIHRQAMKAGLVGAVTGLGGFVTLPIALPIDYYLSTRIQIAMIQFIARTFGQENSMDMRAASFMILSGSGEITQMSQKVLLRYGTRFISRFVGKSFSKFIPFLGAFISFAVNYVLAQSAARLALRWFSEKHLRQQDHSEPVQQITSS